jgi:hypothetical protein
VRTVEEYDTLLFYPPTIGNLVYLPTTANQRLPRKFYLPGRIVCTKADLGQCKLGAILGRQITMRTVDTEFQI